MRPGPGGANAAPAGRSLLGRVGRGPGWGRHFQGNGLSWSGPDCPLRTAVPCTVPPADGPLNPGHPAQDRFSQHLSCLDSVSGAGPAGDRQPWHLRVIFHSAAVSPSRPRPATLDPLAAAPTEPPGPSVAPRKHPGAAGFPQHAVGGRTGQLWPRLAWGRQRHCARLAGTEARAGSPASDLCRDSGPSPWEHSWCPPWGCCVSCAPVPGGLGSEDHPARPSCLEHPG